MGGVGVSFDDQLAVHQQSLPDGQRRVVEVLLGDRGEAAFLPADEVARRAGVSVATTVRVAQRLGFDGYPALRGALQRDLRTTLGQRLRDLPATDDVLATLLAREQSALSGVVSSIPESTITAAATAVHCADRVFISARGHSSAVAELLCRRLRRLGRPVISLTGAGRDVAEALHLLTARDAVVAVALRRQPPLLAAILRHAAKVGAATVVVSDAAGPLLRPRPDHLLASARGVHNGYQTLVVPVLIAEALALAVARLDPAAPAVLDGLERLIETLDR